MAVRVTFYDVPPDGRWPLIATMAEHAWHREKRMLVHCRDAAVARDLDAYLWTFRDDSFLPHELDDGARPLADPEARVVIVWGEHDRIGADVLMLEAPTSISFAERFASVIDLVDHRSPELLAASRQRFATWRDAGVQPDYRKQG